MRSYGMERESLCTMERSLRVQVFFVFRLPLACFFTSIVKGHQICGERSIYAAARISLSSTSSAMAAIVSTRLV